MGRGEYIKKRLKGRVSVTKKLSDGAYLGICLIVSALIFGLFFYNSRAPEKTIRTVGAATESISSDIIKWRVTFSRSAPLDGLQNAYQEMSADLTAFKKILKDQGIETEKMGIQPVATNKNYNSQGVVTGYNISQSIYLISKEMKKVEDLAFNPGLITGRGLLVEQSSLEYYNTQLDEAKRRLLAKATEDAKLRAKEIAKGTGDRVGKIQAAKVGVFQITEPFSTEISDYGIHNTSTKEKEITVTVHVTFALK